MEAHDVYIQNENVFQVNKSPKWKYQDRYYEEDIEIDTNFEMQEKMRRSRQLLLRAM